MENLHPCGEFLWKNQVNAGACKLNERICKERCTEMSIRQSADILSQNGKSDEKEIP